MTKYNREEQLKQLHEMKKQQTIQKVDDAIKRLIKTDRPINFNSVSKEAGVSKATLYAHPSIKGRINSLKEQKEKAFVNKRIDQDENNQKAIIDSLKRKIEKLERKNKELEEENKKLHSKENEKLADYFRKI